MTEQPDQCSNCRFWLSGKGAKEGHCRRYPPTYSGSGEGRYGLYTRNVIVDADYWCGEFQPADPKNRVSG